MNRILYNLSLLSITNMTYGFMRKKDKRLKIFKDKSDIIQWIEKRNIDYDEYFYDSITNIKTPNNIIYNNSYSDKDSIINTLQTHNQEALDVYFVEYMDGLKYTDIFILIPRDSIYNLTH